MIEDRLCRHERAAKGTAPARVRIIIFMRPPGCFGQSNGAMLRSPTIYHRLYPDAAVPATQNLPSVFQATMNAERREALQGRR
jgi:hypothetical protein